MTQYLNKILCTWDLNISKHFKTADEQKCIFPGVYWCNFFFLKLAYPGGIIDFHLCQQFSINAEVAEASPLIVDDTVALAGNRDEPWAQIVFWSLQSPQKVPCDGMDQTRTLYQTRTHMWSTCAYVKKL